MTGKVIILAAGSVIISFLLSREIIHKPVRSVINAVYLLGIFLIFGMVSGIFGIRPAYLLFGYSQYFFIWQSIIQYCYVRILCFAKDTARTCW